MRTQLKKIINHNTIANASKPVLIGRYILNGFRTLIMLKIRYRWIKSNGFLRIPFSTRVWSPNKLVILGNKVQFGKNCLIQCDLEIGNEVLIASNVSFIGRSDHTYSVAGISIWDSPRGKELKTVVGNDCWIGHGSIILAGVNIGHGSIIAAGAVVTNNVEPCSIYGGIPAKKIKCRFDKEEEFKKHLLYIST